MTDPRTNALVPSPTVHSDGSGLLAVRDSDGRFVSASRPDPETADGYLRLTAHLLLEAEKQGFHSIGVVSAMPGEGKTTATVNLGLCLGRTRGKSGRVLLIDGDSRTQALTRMLTPPPTPTDPDPEVEVAGEPVRDRRGPIVRRVFRGGDLLPALPPREGAILNSPSAWAATLERLRPRYRYILVDCPSVLRDPEALVLRECVDRLVVVVRAGRTTRKQIQTAVGDCGKRVAGVILIEDRGPRKRSPAS